MSVETLIRKVPIVLEDIDTNIAKFTTLAGNNVKLINEACNNRLKLARAIQDCYIPSVTSKPSNKQQQELDDEFMDLIDRMQDLKRILKQHITKAQTLALDFKAILHEGIADYGESILKTAVGPFTLSDTQNSIDNIMELFWQEFLLKVTTLDYLISHQSLNHQKAQVFLSLWIHPPYIKKCKIKIDNLLDLLAF